MGGNEGITTVGTEWGSPGRRVWEGNGQAGVSTRKFEIRF